MKKWFKQSIIGLIIVAMAAVAVGCGGGGEQEEGQSLLDSIMEKGVITIATSPDYPPFEFIDDEGAVAGLDIDLINAIAEEMGVTVEISQMGFDSIIGAVKAGQVDIGVSGFTVTEERKESVDFTVTYFTGGQVIIAKQAGMETGIKSAADLKGKLVGAQLGTTGEEAANAIEGAEVRPYEDFLVAIQDLKSGNIDAVVGDILVAEGVVAKNMDLGIVGDPLNAEETAIIVAKGNDDLVAALNEAIAKIKENGKYDEIVSKWAGMEME